MHGLKDLESMLVPLCKIVCKVVNIHTRLSHIRLCATRVSNVFLLYTEGRRRMEFGLVDYPNSELSDEELSEMVRELRQDNPDVVASMAACLLRARGYRVVRARVRDALRNSDPPSAALRWPGGITIRCVYSVAGPNSLWHIGKTFMFCGVYC